jgi:Zn-dependent protease with chaperone function
MRLDVLVIIAGTLLFAFGAPRLGRRLHPAVATRLLVIGSVVVAMSTLSVAVLVALTGVGQVPVVAALGEWSASALRAHDPFPMASAVVCAAIIPLIAMAAVIFLVRRSRALLVAYRTCRHLPSSGSLVIVEHDRPEAFATPHPAGRIVMSTGMLRALSADERRVVLAHESAHLAHQHSWWRLAVDLAATINPLLRATARAVAESIERWADEDAAHEVADRRLAARALARTALLTSSAALVRPLDLAATGGDVPARVRALLAPPPPRRPGIVVALCALVGVLAVTTIVVQFDGDELFSRAGQLPSTLIPYRK